MDDTGAYQEEPRTEIINGTVKIMPDERLNHALIKGNLYVIFGNYFHGKRSLALGGATVFLQKGVEEYKPDLAVVCNPDILGHDGIYGVPDLTVEISSPRTAFYDRGYKKNMYERHGVREYWIVDPANRWIEQYILENGRFTLRDIYIQYTEETFNDLTDEEKAAVVTEFHCSLFDDLTIRVDKVFAHLIDK